MTLRPLLYGAALQKLGRPVSAEREFAAAAKLAPGDPDAQDSWPDGEAKWGLQH